ncbi:hypothetical protein BV898_02368 [Hypsibius exemplaris]|uniref:G-protein coupled receptors family 1 profile domain-containing protein n=1 Tax=Hypsibius exemplaris TaxID=2072580 RepID=A0A1W0X7X0_HYPEX|nr:hypothetical protein BV898_02368 [Hypsibius exemplaris]
MANATVHNTTTASQSNNTSEYTLEPPASWTSTAVFYLVVLILGLLGNGPTLLVLLTDQRLRTTPFNLYVANLLSANLFDLLTQYVMSVIAERQPGHWYMGNAACTLYQYCQGLISGVQLQTHAVIALNRAWAILYPVSYRSWHTTRFACLACAGIWIYAVMWFAFAPILDDLVNRKDIRKEGCMSDYIADPRRLLWSRMVDLLYNFITIACVLLSFALVSVKLYRQLRERQRRHQGTVQLASGGATASNAPAGDRTHSKSPTSRAKGDERTTHGGIDDGTLATVGEDDHGEDLVATCSREGQQGPRLVARLNRSAIRKYILLTILTCSVAVFYCPALFFYVFYDFIPNFMDQPGVGKLFQAAWMTWPCQLVVDPILFALTLDPLRQAMRRILAKILRQGPHPGRVQPGG